MSEENMPPPPAEDIPPPPPVEEPEEQKPSEEMKVKKTSPTASARRAFAILGKDLRTMPKHGLLAAIVTLIVLAVVFSIASYAVVRVSEFDFGGDNEENGNGDGDGPGIVGSGVNLPTAAMTISPGLNSPSGTQLTFDASASTDNDRIVFYVWGTDDGYQDIELYGKVVQFTFYAVGQHEIHLIVVDNEWNINETVRIVNTARAASDNQDPSANIEPVPSINVAETAHFDGSNSTDDTAIVDYTWMFDDGIARILHGPAPTYTFMNAGNYHVVLIVRDAAGNTNQASTDFYVMPLPGDDQPPMANADIPDSVTVGDRIQLDASQSDDNQGISSYTWYVSYNGTVTTLSGEHADFLADKFGPYRVVLVVRDNSGNVNMMDKTVIATTEEMKLNEQSWNTPILEKELSFTFLTYSYGVALLTSVIYIGGLFARGFKHEVIKGTARMLFFEPVSVTTVFFAKILYPLIIGPIFIFPVVFIALARFDQPFMDVFMIGLVSYAMTAITMVSAVYGVNILYLATKKMSLKPNTLTRLFLYFSLLATMAIFEGGSFISNKLLDMAPLSDLLSRLDFLTTFSPFHQGGMLLSNMLTGTDWTLDLWVFAIPLILIVCGIVVSTRLYGEIFERE